MNSPDHVLHYVCDFCGVCQYELKRCAGCGATPSISNTAVKTNRRDLRIKPRRDYSSRKLMFRRAVYSIAGLAVVVGFAHISHTKSLPNFSDQRMPVVRMTSNFTAWATPQTNFKTRQYTEAEIRELLTEVAPMPHQLQYVGVHQSANSSRVVKLNLKRSEQPTVLVLSSYKPVSWVINNKYNNDLAAIIYGSHHHGSNVSGDISNDTSLLAATTRIGKLASRRSCGCIAEGLFQCTGSDPNQTIETIQNLSAGTITGISNADSATALDVPQRIIKANFWQKKKRQHSENACRT